MPTAEHPVRRRLGDAIADRRRALGLSRRQLAERAALSYPFVSELERGSKSPSTASLSSLASALELTVAELVGAAERPEADHAERAGQGDEPPPESAVPTMRGGGSASADHSELGRFLCDIVRDELAAAQGRRNLSGSDEPPRQRAQRVDALAAEVLDTVRQLLGDDAVVVDDQGDVPIPRDGAMVFVRILDDPPSVLVFCPTLVDLPSTPALLERLNDLNEGVRFVRFCATEGGVVVDLELFGDAFDGSLLQLAVRAVSGAAARFGADLQREFGGRLFLDAEPLLDRPRNTAGYL